MTYDPLSFLMSARLLCYLTVGMGCWFANICMCLWRYFPVLWRLTRISDAIWITMECLCLDIDIHLLEKCAGRRIKIDVKVSHFDMFSPADLCTLDMVNSRKWNIQYPSWLDIGYWDIRIRISQYPISNQLHAAPQMQHFITGSRLTHILIRCRNHMILFPMNQNNNMVTSSHGCQTPGWNIIWSRLDLDLRLNLQS